MLDFLINGSDIQKGLFVTIVGMAGVFIVLILFYLIIRLFSQTLPAIGDRFSKRYLHRQEENNN